MVDDMIASWPSPASAKCSQAMTLLPLSFYKKKRKNCFIRKQSHSPWTTPIKVKLVWSSFDCPRIHFTSTRVCCRSHDDNWKFWWLLLASSGSVFRVGFQVLLSKEEVSKIGPQGLVFGTFYFFPRVIWFKAQCSV